MNIENKIILENSKNLNVLYVEDDTFVAGVTKKLFQNFFNTVDTAIDGEDGLEMYRTFIKNNDTNYDLVISDINMPKLNGIDMCKIIKHINFEQAIILISANDDVQCFLDAIRIGVSGFLIKPIEIKQLQNVLYTTTLSISDRKIVQRYYEQLEDKFVDNLNTKDTKTQLQIPKAKEVKTKDKKKEELLSEDSDTNYAEFFIDSDIAELKELEEDIDALAVQVTIGKTACIEDTTALAMNIKRYGEILHIYPMFEALGECIKKLGISLNENSQLLFDDKQRMKNISALLEGFVNDLIIWRKEIFDNNTDTPNFLDASFFSNTETIIMFIEYDESEEVDGEGDMEFF